jgi:NADH-quinone oxidoreductase subunit N
MSPTIDYVFIKDKKSMVSIYLTVIGLVISAITLLFAFSMFPIYSQRSFLVYDGALKIDFYGVFLAFIATIAAILVVIASASYRDWNTSPSFYSLLILGILGVYYLIFVNDFVLLIAAWALVSVVSYVIAGIRKDIGSVEGAVKYAIMGVLASVLMLFAVANIYGLANTTNISQVITSLKSSPSLINNQHMLLLGVLLFISAFGFKIGIVPFHGWLPDVYGGVHPISVSFLAGVVKIAGVAVILRILFPLASIIGNIWLIIFAILSIFSMTFGNIVALIQGNMQRMMAYSSIAHIGYILIGVTALSSTTIANGVSSIDFALVGIAVHLFASSVAKVGMFVALAYLLRKKVGVMMDDFKGLGKSMPVLSISLLILLLSLIGVPPLLGFWGKLYLFTSVVGIAPWLALIAIINSGIAVGYYVQAIRYMFFVEGEGKERERVEDYEVIIAMITAVITIIVGIFIPIFTPYLTILY